MDEIKTDETHLEHPIQIKQRAFLCVTYNACDVMKSRRFMCHLTTMT